MEARQQAVDDPPARSGPITSVGPAVAASTVAAVRSAADSSARTTVVPTAITRPPRPRAALTRAAVEAGTRKRSGYGASPRSSEDTPGVEHDRRDVDAGGDRAASRART